MKIFSPMPTGNGAWIIHEYLHEHLDGYGLAGFDPRLALFPPLLRLISVPAVDLVHTLPEFGPFPGRAGIPFVVTFHNYVLDRGMRPYCSALQYAYYRTILRPLTLQSLRRAAAVTCVSEGTARLVREDLNWKEPLYVIRNGIDIDRFRPPTRSRKAGDDKVNVLFSGNLSRRKGAYLLPDLVEATPGNVHIWYTGGLRRTRRNLPSHPRLHNLGRVDYRDMPEVYSRADLLVAPTVREGGPSLAVAEAMACGLPVIASKVSALPETIVDGKGGLLCAVGDTGAFASGVNRLAHAPQLRREMGEFNRARAEKLFDYRRMVAEYRALFEGLVSG